MDEDVEDLATVQHVAQHAVRAVGVHVALVVGVGANQKLAVAHGGKVLQAGSLIEVGAVGVEQELGAVAELRTRPVIVDLDVDHVGNVVLGVVRGDGGVEVGNLARVTVQGVHEALDEGGKAEGAGVHDAVLLQDGQEVGRAGNGLIGLDDKLVQHVVRGDVGLLELVRLGGDVLEHGEDGAGDGLAHRLEGDLDAVAQGGGDVCGSCVRALGGNQALRHAAQDLAGDDAGVAAGTHEGAVGDGLGDVRHGGGSGQGVDLLDDGPQRQGHVGAGVAVGHGEHVELVDVLCLVCHDLGGGGEASANGIGNHLSENLGSLLADFHAPPSGCEYPRCERGPQRS